MKWGTDFDYGRTKHNGFARLASAAAACALALPASAWAQMEPAQADAAGAPELEEIVVTARKREESLQRTPVAVTAMGEAELQTRNAQSLLDIGNFMPNVVVGSQSTVGTQGGAFYIRGIGQDRNGISFDQGVGLYVDDVYQARSDNSLLAIVDVERVEVLRGPQGTLFGKNTIGGAVRYITRKPTPDLGGYVDLTVGSFDRFDVKAAVNVPLTDRFFAKAAFGSLNRAGFVKEVIGDRRFGDQDTQVGRLQFRALVSDTVTFDIEASKSRARNNGRSFTIDAINPDALYPQLLRRFTNQVYDSRYVSPTPYSIYGGHDADYRFNGWGLSGTLTAELSDTLTLKSVTAYNEASIRVVNDWDGTALPVYKISSQRELDEFSQELQLSGTAFRDRLSWVAGLYYMHESPTDDSVQDSVGNMNLARQPIYPLTIDTAVATKVDSYAGYAQGTFKFNDFLSTTLGIRYSRDEKLFQAANTTFNTFSRDRDSWDNWSPRASIELQWTPDVMTYASVARGFRSGGLNSGVITGAVELEPYDPEIVTTYELGLRSDLFGRLRFNLTGFYTSYRDQQLTVRHPVFNVATIQNVGRSHLMGVEVESILAVTSRFRLQGTFGYLDGEYDELGGATGLTKDSILPRTPKFSYSIGARYVAPVGNGEVVASIDWSWRDDQSTASTDTNTQFLDAYGLLGGRLQYNAPDERWSVALFATNLLDEVYYLGGVDQGRPATPTSPAGFVGPSTLDIAPPREIGVNLRFKF